MEYVEFPTGGKKKTILQWNCTEDLLLAGYIILFWNKFRN